MPTGVYVRTPEIKEKLKQAQTKSYQDNPERKEKIRQGNIKYYQDNPEVKEKQSQVRLGHKTSEETKRKIGKSHRGKIVSEAQKEKQRISMTGKHWKLSSETKEKQRQATKKYLQEHPEAKEKLRQSNVGRKHSSKTIENMKQGQNKYHKEHPEANEKQRQAQLQNYRDHPEIGEKISQTQKERYQEHPEAIKRGEEHWSYGKPSPQLHIFSALDRLVKDKYCPLFTNKLREQVRIRDGHICQLCGKTQVEEGKKLNVHHIHYDKPNCYPDLICLCRSCNIKANTNRDYWEQFYMNKLNERNLLFWTRRNSQ